MKGTSRFAGCTQEVASLYALGNGTSLPEVTVPPHRSRTLLGQAEERERLSGKKKKIYFWPKTTTIQRGCRFSNASHERDSTHTVSQLQDWPGWWQYATRHGDKHTSTYRGTTARRLLFITLPTGTQLHYSIRFS